VADFETWKATATSDEVAVAVCFNRQLFRQFAEASERLEGARELDTETLGQFARKVVELKAAVEADQAEHVFVFRTVPYGPWRDLAERHPATAEQLQANRYLEFNPDTFPQAAIALSCHDPALTEDDADWLREHLPRAEFDRLFQAVITVNVGGSSIPKSVTAIVDKLASELSSTTPPKKASRSRSSAAG
jgi:hypothetical protein